jgi:hypothetical protein
VWLIIPTVTVYVVYVKLAYVYWHITTLLTYCAFVFSIWIDAVVIGSLPYCATAIPTREWVLLISQLHLGWTTNRARGSAFFFVMVTELVLHLCLLDRVRIPDSRS